MADSDPKSPPPPYASTIEQKIKEWAAEAERKESARIEAEALRLTELYFQNKGLGKADEMLSVSNGYDIDSVSARVRQLLQPLNLSVATLNPFNRTIRIDKIPPSLPSLSPDFTPWD